MSIDLREVGIAGDFKLVISGSCHSAPGERRTVGKREGSVRRRFQNRQCERTNAAPIAPYIGPITCLHAPEVHRAISEPVGCLRGIGGYFAQWECKQWTAKGRVVIHL